jgi:hypothetical protein
VAGRHTCGVRLPYSHLDALDLEAGENGIRDRRGQGLDQVELLGL